METWMVILLIIADLIIGVIFAAPRYAKKLEELEQKLRRERPGEYLEFGFWKELRWTFLNMAAWWFVFPYEWLTHWRHWTYPYCLRGGAPKGWDKPIAIRPQEDIVAAIQISGKAAAEEVNKRVKKLEGAQKISPKLLKMRVGNGRKIPQGILRQKVI